MHPNHSSRLKKPTPSETDANAVQTSGFDVHSMILFSELQRPPIFDEKDFEFTSLGISIVKFE
jgi:hypothetical protein